VCSKHCTISSADHFSLNAVAITHAHFEFQSIEYNISIKFALVHFVDNSFASTSSASELLIPFTIKSINDFASKCQISAFCTFSSTISIAGFDSLNLSFKPAKMFNLSSIFFHSIV